MENGGAVGGYDIRLYAEFGHEIFHPLPQEAAIFAVEGHELVGAHILDVLSQLLLKIGRIIVTTRTINVKAPLAIFKSESSKTNIQAVHGSTGHKAYAGHGFGHSVQD